MDQFGDLIDTTWGMFQPTDSGVARSGSEFRRKRDGFVLALDYEPYLVGLPDPIIITDDSGAAHKNDITNRFQDINGGADKSFVITGAKIILKHRLGVQDTDYVTGTGAVPYKKARITISPPLCGLTNTCKKILVEYTIKPFGKTVTLKSEQDVFVPPNVK